MEGKILVIDDERGIVQAIAYALRREGYTVEVGYDGEEALKKVKCFCPKVLILDIMMPQKSGFEVLRNLQNESEMGLILLTARNDIVDKVLGLELGADDYITKPFDIREVVARVHSLMRRLEKAGAQAEQEIQIADLKVILAQRKVLLKGNELELALKEFDLLVLLISHLERVYSRDELLDIVWGIEYIGGTRTVDTHIQRLRKKLGPTYHNLIQSVYGFGYKAVGGFNEREY